MSHKYTQKWWKRWLMVILFLSNIIMGCMCVTFQLAKLTWHCLGLFPFSQTDAGWDLFDSWHHCYRLCWLIFNCRSLLSSIWSFNGDWICTFEFFGMFFQSVMRYLCFVRCIEVSRYIKCATSANRRNNATSSFLR